jgi:hypothetical protein
MRRALCLFSAICFSVSLVGCGGDSVNDGTSAVTAKDAQAVAAKMPMPSDPHKTDKKK